MRTLMFATLSLCLLIGVPTVAASAEDDLAVKPNSCQGVATVQKRDCTVENTFKCGDLGDEFVRIEQFNGYGERSFRHVAPNFDTLSYTTEGSGIQINFPKIVYGRPSISQILDGELDSLTQTGTFEFFGITKPVVLVSTRKRVDQTETISGLVFEMYRLEAQMVFPRPAPPINAKSLVYHNRDLNLTILVEGGTDVMGEMEIDGSMPVEIFLPGEAGFGNGEPKFDCPLQSSAIVPNEF
jgi:hypothetical protein